MANVKDVKNKAVKIVLADGVEREVRFTLNSLADLEDKYGSIEAAFAEVDKGNIRAIRFVLWAGIASGDENITERQVGNLIDMATMENILASLQGAISSDLPTDAQLSDPN